MKDKIIEELKEVYDPEIPINVYDLGLIYKIEKVKSKWKITMSLTSETCPTKDFIMSMIKDACERIVGENNCEVILTFTPRWSPKMVTEEVREELGIEDTPNNFENKQKERICFKCDLKKEILIECFYFDEKRLICFDCLKKL